MAAKLNEMSTVILDWIREMDNEPGGTLHDIAVAAGADLNPAAMAKRMDIAFIGINFEFLTKAPGFLRDVFKCCVDQIDWEEVVRTRFAESADE